VYNDQMASKVTALLKKSEKVFCERKDGRFIVANSYAIYIFDELPVKVAAKLVELGADLAVEKCQVLHNGSCLAERGPNITGVMDLPRNGRTKNYYATALAYQTPARLLSICCSNNSEPVAVNAAYLAPFTVSAKDWRVDHEMFRVDRTNSPLLISDGEKLIGAIIPIVRNHSWADIINAHLEGTHDGLD
jgi:hypothetical protein